MAGTLNYPVLQAADILLYLADLVPVGEDQVQHLGLPRRRPQWNSRWGLDASYFPEPQPRLTPTRRIVGLDGQAKVSKSLGNNIGLLEEPEAIWEKLRPAVTDPARQRKTDKGDPDKCPIIYQLHRAFSPEATVHEVETNCREAQWGCIDCKKALRTNVVVNSRRVASARRTRGETSARERDARSRSVEGTRRGAEDDPARKRKMRLPLESNQRDPRRSADTVDVRDDRGVPPRSRQQAAARRVTRRRIRPRAPARGQGVGVSRTPTFLITWDPR